MRVVALLRFLPLLALVPGAAFLPACGAGTVTSPIAQPPELETKDAKCSVKKSQENPLVVEWQSTERQRLEARAQDGVVAVRYVGCEMTILSRCTAPAKYGYRATTLAKDRVVIRNEDELYANLPIGAASLEGKLAQKGQLTVDMDLVGRLQADHDSLLPDDLKGDCDGATHFVYALSVGAFDFSAGGQASASGSATFAGAGAGGSSSSDKETVTQNGDPDKCASSAPGDKGPPAGCGAVIRIEVVPLGKAKAYTPSCPDGTQWDGKQCLATQVLCPAGAQWDGTKCAATAMRNDPPPEREELERSMQAIAEYRQRAEQLVDGQPMIKAKYPKCALSDAKNQTTQSNYRSLQARYTMLLAAHDKLGVADVPSNEIQTEAKALMEGYKSLSDLLALFDMCIRNSNANKGTQ